MLALFNETLSYVVATLIHNAPILAFGILVAAAIMHLTCKSVRAPAI